MLNTPVLFIVFNRPDTTARVFEAIRQAKPKQLFVAADGPRPNKDGEKERCEIVRQIATKVDWDCELRTLFRSENRGCGRGPAEAITWFFENVEQGIILEDDCLPDQSFFWFCEELLEYYKYDERIMHITGNNFQFGEVIGVASYYSSIYTHNWGWATWKRAWAKFEYILKDVKIFTTSQSFYDLFSSDSERKFWQKSFSGLNGENYDVWDIQWQYCIQKNNGISLIPNKNLVSNIGFGQDATHTYDCDSLLSKISTSSISVITHLKEIERIKLNDLKFYNKVYAVNTSSRHFSNIFLKILKKIFPKS